jgi:pimeloyl-ACP methyl ester carboxylesterase
MKPFYFGRPERSLFGVYHPPLTGHHPGHGVVLCYPLGHEYIYGHRAFRQLAVHLARAGFAVLRFDYYACGDSAGACEEGAIDRWLGDIGAALQEIKETGKASKTHLVGARMGAALSAKVAGQRSDIDGLVLWDPVLTGKQYVRDLLTQHARWLSGRGVAGSVDRDVEALGFPLSAGLQKDLSEIELPSMPLPGKRVLIVDSDPAAPGAELKDRLGGARLEYRHVSAPQVWSRNPGRENALVPMAVLQTITSWMSANAK